MIYLYRKNGNKVIGASIDNSTYDSVNSTYYGTIIDPAIPDGGDLSVPKIVDGSSIRNATAPEIANFAVAEAADANLQNRESAISSIDNNVVQKKVLQAITSVIVDELNTLRQWEMSFKTEVAAATSLANLQTRVAGLPNLPDRTLAQAVTAVRAKINAGDVD